MRLALLLSCCLCLGLLAGCHASTPASAVPLQGERGDINRIAGTWEGEFENEATGRTGRIFLELKAESDTAYGRISFDRAVPIGTCTDMSRPQATSTVVLPVVLRLGGLATARGSLGGWILPYRDAELSCWMDTWFEGKLVQDTLRGAFFSRRTDNDSVRAGSWWAARQ
jgi:hypothetical protein